MTRWWKLIVFAAALLGLHGFFEPFLQLGTGEDAIRPSAYLIRVGYESIEQVYPHLAGMDPNEARTLLRKINEAVKTRARGSRRR